MVREGMPYFTIFIPTYNRLSTLPRLIDSLNKQTFRDFEVVIVDDGSTDGTSEFIKSITNDYDFKIIYIWQNNSGKHIARNRALDIARGYFFFTIDSDDIILPKALELIKKYWEMIPVEKRTIFAGIEGLDINMVDLSIIGNKYPQDIYDSTYIETRFIDKVSGEKNRAVITDIFRQYKYPEIKGENFITEAIIWNRMALKYKFRHINIPLVGKEFRRDGLSANSIRIRALNPKGAILYYKEFINDISSNYKVCFRYKLRHYINYVRFSKHASISVRGQRKEVVSSPIFWISIIPGYILWYLDMFRIKSAGNRK